ncbi:CBS domain-containing protein [Methylobacterium sp. CM6247]
MLVRDVMTSNVCAITPDRTIRDAARLMDELNVGILPVCLDTRLVGVITDRDIVVRSSAAGQAPGDQSVQEILTTDVTTCGVDDAVEGVMDRMRQLQVRRMPVVDQDRHLVGLVSLGDLADGGAPGTADALRDISSPAEPDRSGTLSTARADTTRNARHDPLTEEEHRELAGRLAQPPGPRPDAGRAPDADTGRVADPRAAIESEVARAAFGLAGSPVGAEPGRMEGGFGGDGYNNYGEMFGPEEDRVRGSVISDDTDPSPEFNAPVGRDGGDPAGS